MQIGAHARPRSMLCLLLPTPKAAGNEYGRNRQYGENGILKLWDDVENHLDTHGCVLSPKEAYAILL